MARIDTYALGRLDAQIPDYNAWPRSCFEEAMRPRMTAALIDFEEWSQALEFYEYTKCSPAPLHRFWTQWCRNQSFLMRLLNEQDGEGTQVRELPVDFWSA